jgi:outer membrane protein assembly factor BamB
VVSRLSQTIRAFNIHLGNENWNFSVGSLDITLAASKRPRSGIISDQQDCLRLSDESEDIEATSFRFDVATGTVFAVSADGNNQLWQYQVCRFH